MSHVYGSMELLAVVPHTHAPRAHGAVLARQSIVAVEKKKPNTLTMTTGRNATVIIFE